MTYTYNGDGERVMKSNGTLYWGGGEGGALSESDLSGNIQHEYISFNGKRTARIDLSNSSVHYYFADHLGTTAVVINSTGSLPFDEDLDYYPYGGIVTGSTDNVPQNYKFNGKERDAESGLDNFGARFDASTLGRFMTPDWAAKPTTVPYANFGNPQSLNLYSFVQNNPTTLGDPDGHCGDGGDTTCSANLSVTQVTGIVFNETQSLSGNNVTLSDARQSAAHAIINGDNALGDKRPATATDKVSAANQKSQTYKDTKADVQCACQEAAHGVDPTNGSTKFNLRANDSTAPFQGADQQTQSGPLQNSFPTTALPKGSNVYVNTYKLPTNSGAKQTSPPPPPSAPAPPPPPPPMKCIGDVCH